MKICSKSQFQRLILVTISTLVIISGSYVPTVFGWHENLAISDQQAAQFYKTKPNDPEIIAWENLIQHTLVLMDQANCERVVEMPLATYQHKVHCRDLAKLVYGNCISHPDTLLVCFDPKIARLTGILNFNQNSSNSSITR